ncbi:MAG: hypothetical protein LBD77_10040 [Bifidobacteriaceae bacterium]|jgi:hypothetical protein|nr:hypothetical protein [Bifidobacteriaceae bacterium]
MEFNRDEALEAVRRDTQWLRKVTARMRAERDKLHTMTEESMAEAVRKRRSGESGRAWQRLQQRIDMGTTSLEDVMMGMDHSRDAMEVRDDLTENLGKFAIECNELRRQGLFDFDEDLDEGLDEDPDEDPDDNATP